MSKRILASIAGALLVGLVWLIAQNTQATNSLAPLFPGGALVYVEARDLAGLVADWNGSSEKKLWLASSNYDVFSRTRLFMRLAEAQQQFADAAGFAPDMSLVNSIAGGQSAVAIYDIGELEFLYITRLPSAHILASTPFAARSSYESRESAGIPYYVRSGANRRVAAFGSTDGLLFLGTRSDLVANALALYAKRQSVSPLASDGWFTDLTRTAPNAGEVRIALNMPALLKTPYFRSYWVQRNASQLRPFRAGVVDLFREAGQIREDRVLIREVQTTAPNEKAVAEIVAWVPPEVGLHRAWAAPTTDHAMDIIRGGANAAPSRSAPIAADPDAMAGDASDLETRIDQLPLNTATTDALAPLRPILNATGLQAMVHIESSRPSEDGVFVRTDSVVGLLGAANWPAITLPDVIMHRQGRILLLSNNAAFLQRVIAQLSAAPAAPAAYSARYLHSRELGPFTRMMTQIDAASENAGTEPRFFSQNVASLGRVLNRVESASIVAHDDGSRLTQRMVYKVRP